MVDVAVGMRNDDDAKLIYIGKKHINFSNRRSIKGEREKIDLSKAFEGFLKSQNLIDKENLEKNLRWNYEANRENSR